MASVTSSTSSLSSTLRGYGGMASGIDRDSIIEQMSLATTTKIQNQKNSITSLTWKQESFRSIINQILDLQDNYLSYAATSSVMDSSLFSKNVITANGDEKISKYVSVSGSSDMLDSMSVAGVQQLASAANVQSAEKGEGAIKTEMSYNTQAKESNLEGTNLVFGYYGHENKFTTLGTFTMPSSYKDGNTTIEIDYTTDDLDKLAGQLNKAIESNKFELKDTGITIQFKANGDNLEIEYATVDKTNGFKVNENSQSAANAEAERQNIVIRNTSSALSALGFKKDLEGAAEIKTEGGYKLSDYNSHISSTKDNYTRTYSDMGTYLKGKKFTVSYGGQSKQVELITSADVNTLAEEKKLLQEKVDRGEIDEDQMQEELNEKFASIMETNLGKAFGKDKIGVEIQGGKIAFTNAKGDHSTLSITSSDYNVMKATGLQKMNSTKVSLEASLYNNRERLGITDDMYASYKAEYAADDPEADLKAFDAYIKDNFEINGVKINASADMTMNQLLVNINSSKAGVKASYLSTSNKFTLVSTETGSGRTIELTGDAANMIFKGKGENGDWGGESVDGKDAIMYVDYGTGSPERVVSSTNTFDMDGLKITVSGEFGIAKNDDGDMLDENGQVLKEGKRPKFDRTQAVTFNASADVDKAVETVKKFLEDYNALVKAINTEITTKPDSNYGPLTDEQKDEMDETSIENWEKKAKQGLLFNNGVMRDLSLDMQGVLTKIMNSGVSYDDLEEIGITMSSDPYDGGTLTFDETKFRAAMENDPEKVGDIFTGGNGVNEGISSIVNDTLKQYATKYAYMNGGSYGRLVEEAGSERISLSLQYNTIYNQLKDMQETLTSLQTKLQTEQDRYIQMFTRMETAISNMNSQSSYLSSITG